MQLIKWTTNKHQWWFSLSLDLRWIYFSFLFSVYFCFPCLFLLLIICSMHNTSKYEYLSHIKILINNSLHCIAYIFIEKPATNDGNETVIVNTILILLNKNNNPIFINLLTKKYLKSFTIIHCYSMLSYKSGLLL